jgi:hypothetical protein
MKELNKLVLAYQKTKDESLFNRIYEMVSGEWKNLHTVGKSVMADEHQILALYEDVLMNCIERYTGQGDFIRYYRAGLRMSRAALYKDQRRYYGRFEPSNNETNDEGTPIAATIESLPDPITIEEIAFRKTEADQRQLIDFLVSGADATTTAIVEAFLAHPRPTPTAIGRKLGLHHSVVKRKLERLAGKFDAKQFGDYRDYLAVAR